MEIRRLYREGFSQRDLGDKYNVSKSCIQKLVEKRSWKEVK